MIFGEEYDEVAILASGTIVDKSGKTPSGQTGEAFFISISYVKPSNQKSHRCLHTTLSQCWSSEQILQM